MKGLVEFGIAEGNPGALNFLIDAYNKNPFGAELAFQRMWHAGVVGSRLYMLWNDCCDRNTEEAIYAMTTKEIGLILHHIDGGRGRGIPFNIKPVSASNEAKA